jgi:hypothetical protein
MSDSSRAAQLKSVALRLFFLAFAQFLKKPKQDKPLLFRKDKGRLFHRGRVFPKDRGDERGPSPSVPPGHAPVLRILALHQRFLFQPIDRDTDRSRRKPYLGTYRVDRQRPVVKHHFEYAEIRVAETRPARIQALLRASAFLCIPSASHRILPIEFKYLDINITS